MSKHKVGTTFRGGIKLSSFGFAMERELSRQGRCCAYYHAPKGGVALCTLPRKGHGRLHGKDPVLVAFRAAFDAYRDAVDKPSRSAPLVRFRKAWAALVELAGARKARSLWNTYQRRGPTGSGLNHAYRTNTNPSLI